MANWKLLLTVSFAAVLTVVFADGRWQTAQVFDRVKLPIAARLTGPAIVQQMDATTVIEPGAASTVDAIGNLRIVVGGGP